MSKKSFMMIVHEISTKKVFAYFLFQQKGFEMEEILKAFLKKPGRIIKKISIYF